MRTRIVVGSRQQEAPTPPSLRTKLRDAFRIFRFANWHDGWLVLIAYAALAATAMYIASL